MPQNPYVIYGKIKKDGTLQNNVDVTIKNVTKNQEYTIKTNSVGEYAIDLGDTTKYSSGYTNGDSVKVTTLTAERQTAINTSLFGEKLDINIKTVSMDLIIKKVYTKQRTFDILNKKLGVLKEKTIDVAFRRLSTSKTLDIDARLLKMFSKNPLMDAALKKLGMQKQRNFDILNKKFGVLKEKTIDSIFKKLYQKTRDIDAILRKSYFVSKTFDSVFKTSKEKPRNIDVLTKKESIFLCTTIESVIRKLAILAEYSIDTVQIKKEILKTFGLDVIFGAVTVVYLNSQLDVIFKKYDVLNSKTVDAALLKGYGKTAAVDADLKKTFSKVRLFSTFIKKIGITKSTAVDAYMGTALVRYVALDSFLKNTVQVQRGFNALLKKSAIQKQFGADSILTKPVLKQFGLDSCSKETFELQRTFNAMLKKSAIEKQLGIDSKFLKKTELQRSLDVLFKKSVILKQFGIDVKIAQILYTYTLTGNVDGILKKVVEKSVACDSDFSKTFTTSANLDASIRFVSTLNAVVDAYMKKLATQKTAAIDGYFGVVVAYYKIVIGMSSITPIEIGMSSITPIQIGMSNIDPITISCEDV